MARILVVEDSRTQSEFLRGLLESHGYTVSVAESGVAALEQMGLQPPHLVLTDLLMPQMTGLELVEHVRRQFPRVPTILITEYGNEDVAAEALQRGAVGYIPKRRLAKDLLRTIDSVLGIAKANPRHQRLLQHWSLNQLQFELDNDLSLVPHLVSHLQDCTGLMRLCDETAQLRLGIALSEALTNAIYHGNLEIQSALREGDGDDWFTAANERQQLSPYSERRVHVNAEITPKLATFVIRDEGPGFDPAQLPDPREPSNLNKSSGRGLLLMRTFMDEVRHNSIGNEITLIKRGVEPRAE